MSKFYQYINEKLVSNEVTEAGETISKDCTEIIDFYKESPVVSHGTAIFRGNNKRFSVISNKIKPQKNRRPTDTPLEMQKKLDEEFKKQFGGKPRSSGVFAFGDNGVHGYGKPCAVFPADSGSYLGSPEVTDLYMKLQDDGVLYSRGIAEYYRNNPEELNDYIRNIVNTYTNKNLNSALLANREIIIGCNYYYLIEQNAGEGILDNFIKKDKDEFVNFTSI